MPYATLIDKPLYASNYTRLDIFASVNYLPRYMLHPHVDHWIQTKQILRYLKGTLDKGLMFNKFVSYTLVDLDNSSFANESIGK